ncbi:MAG TPA: aminodeoxychorismate synthase component I [Gammaproteobacteria bacterium]|nr:aminodeoxychorismate synthase component I [Gammaproteobacteria bacterium]
MSAPRVAELEYSDAVARRFRALADLPWPVWLDSSARGGPSGRYDIFAADPSFTLRTRGENTEIVSRDGAVTASPRSPFALLRERLGEPCERVAELPFCGGAIGYFGYDLGRRLERLPSLAAADVDMPELAMGLYDWAVIVDHERRSTRLVGLGRDPRTFEQWPSLLERLTGSQAKPAAPFRVLTRARSSFSRDEYAEAFRRVQEHIRVGDCYQVNLTQRFEARADGDPWAAYLKLREINPAPFAAYLDFPDGKVLCSSPELFLRVVGRSVETKPIKGTRPRAADRARDHALADALRSSAKDRAENVMIVDLLRNDLGKSCAPGSVHVSKLFDIESFASVHQLVSTVEGRLAPGKDALDLLEGCFPGGSITGAPKVRAMQIIEELEPQRRSVYCGAIGYVGYDGNMELNIAIRTLVQHGDSIYAWAGGGVVADSEVESEYQESLDKAAALLEVLNERVTNVAR